jgi:molybdate/tungstate transport system substrate-binding protein
MRRIVLPCLLIAVTAGPFLGCTDRNEVVVFHAASLSRVFSDLAEQLSRSQQLHLRLEPSGSQVAARKIAELNSRADLVAVADPTVIDELLVPEHARWSLAFAANEIVIAHREHSRHTETLTETNWPEVLGREEVRLGMVDPDLAPIGYYALMVLQLAERQLADDPTAAGLAERLQAKTRREHRVGDENEVVALLAARAVDYVFVYRSTAEDHHLKITALPSTCNLGDPSQAARYREALVRVQMKSGAPPVAVHGRPILAGLTLPLEAPNPRGGMLLLDALLADPGRAALLRAGFRPLDPVLSRHLEALPPALRSRAAPLEATP